MLSDGFAGIVRDLDGLGRVGALMDTAAEVKPLTVAVTNMVPPCRHVSVLPETVAVEVSRLVNVTFLVVSRSPT